MSNNEAVDLLRSIDTSLKVLVSFAQTRAKAATAAAPREVAPDRDLDGKWGDPLIRFNPRGWKGPSLKDRKMSQCPAEFLDLLAEAHDWFAEKAEQNGEMTKSENPKPKGPFERQAAARARGWAKRIRAGGGAPKLPIPVTQGDAWEGDDEEDQGRF